MAIFKIISQYFWVVGIAVMCLNTLIWATWAKPKVKNNEGMREGRNRFLLGYLFWMNLPWVVMGIGCTIGGVPTVFHYFRPRDGNTFVLAWWGAVLVLYIVSIYWVFFCGGVEKLGNYQFFYYRYIGSSVPISSPNAIKLLFALCLAGGIIAAVFMWTVDMPLPEFLM